MAKKKAARKNSRVHANSAAETCFVICPFGGWFDSYSKEIFYPAIEDADLRPLRADDIYGPRSIVADIWQSVRRSRVLLADLTGRNPNVLYELGLAHATQRPVVMVAQTMDDVPFDLRALRVILYDLQAPDWGAKLRGAITKSLREVIASPEQFVPATFLQESHRRASGGTVEPQEKRILQLEQQVASLQRTIQNSIYKTPYLSTTTLGSLDPSPEFTERLIRASEGIQLSEVGQIRRPTVWRNVYGGDLAGLTPATESRSKEATEASSATTSKTKGESS